jgi:hypothetical protein
MAVANDLGNLLGYVDKRAGRGGTMNIPASAIANYRDIAGLRARLTAINATSYSSARLDSMTENDMIYALRLNDDAAGI